MIAHLLAKSFYQSEAGGILLSSNDELGLGNGGKGAVDQLHILWGKDVMVTKCEWRQLRYQWFQVVRHLLW